jgi:hypothetical protein
MGDVDDVTVSARHRPVSIGPWLRDDLVQGIIDVTEGSESEGSVAIERRFGTKHHASLTDSDDGTATARGRSLQPQRPQRALSVSSGATERRHADIAFSVVHIAY